MPDVTFGPFESELANCGCCGGGGFVCDDDAFAACLGVTVASHPECRQYDLDGDGDVDFTDLGLYRHICYQVYISCSGSWLDQEMSVTVDSGCDAYLPAGSSLPITQDLSWVGGTTWASGNVTIEVDASGCTQTISFVYGAFDCSFTLPFTAYLGGSTTVGDCLSTLPAECGSASLDFAVS